MRSSVPLYDALAVDYDDHFTVPHRRAYDDLAWDQVLERLGAPVPGRPVVDAGCGVGRWAQRLVGLGHEVIGVEQAPSMARAARERGLGERFTVIEGPMQDERLPAGRAAAVLAMGSLQYTPEPAAVIARFREWTAPGGLVGVLVDGLVSLVVELVRSGRIDEAEQRRCSRTGVWSTNGCAADMHLFDAATLARAMSDAGLVDVTVSGLLCGWTVLGRDAFLDGLDRDHDGALAREADWARDPAMADTGKQLLAFGRAPLG